MPSFCEYLVTKGRISTRQLAQAQSRTNSVNLATGDCGFAFGFLERVDILRILAIQKRTHQKFGEIAVGLGLLTDGQLHTILRIQSRYRMTLEEALVDDGVMTRQEIDEEKRRFGRIEH
jgi:hypothetical protein